MLAISVELLHGIFRGDPDGLANTGRLQQGEWPPSPFRLFAALVAADGTGPRCAVTDGSELEWFERQPPPEVHADPAPHHQPLQSRFVVLPGRIKKQHLEYVARKGAAVRPGVRVSSRNPHIVYVWPNSDPSAVKLKALRLRASRVGYLGTSDSPVRLRVTAHLPKWEDSMSSFRPDVSGDVLLSVAKPGTLIVLDRIFDLFTERGASVNRNQFPVLQNKVIYSSPNLPRHSHSGEVVVWLRLKEAVSGRRISLVTQQFKKAVLSQYQGLFGEPPIELHGHGYRTKGYQVARFLALPDAGFRWSDGRIHGLALWMPPGTDDLVQNRARSAAASIRRLMGLDKPVDIAVMGNATRPMAARRDRWTKAARVWVTAFPAIHERRCTLDLPEISRWCQHAGLPEPTWFKESRHPLLPGGVDLAPTEVNRPNRPPLPYSHVAIGFDESVHGPVVVGSGRQRGFGLCVPCKVQAAGQPGTKTG